MSLIIQIDKDSTAQALADLNLLYPELTPGGLVEYLIQMHWCRNYGRIQKRKTGKNPFHDTMKK